MAERANNKRWGFLYDAAMIVVGSIIFAIGLDCF